MILECHHSSWPWKRDATVFEDYALMMMMMMMIVVVVVMMVMVVVGTAVLRKTGYVRCPALFNR